MLQLITFEEKNYAVLNCEYRIKKEVWWDRISQKVQKNIYTSKGVSGEVSIFQKVWPGKVRVRLKMLKGHSIFEVPKMVEGRVVVQVGYGCEAHIRMGEFYQAGFKARWVLFESGGGYTNTGAAQIICGLDGSPLKPLYVRRRGHLACGNHAAFAIWQDQTAVAVRASHHRGEFEVKISQLRGAPFPWRLEEEIIWEGECIFPENLEEVLPGKFEKFKTAIRSAMEKATCYHCREPHYIRTSVRM